MYMWELARYVFAQNTIQLLHFLYKLSLLPWLFVTFQIHYYCDMGTIFIIQTIYVILHKVVFILTAKFSFSGFHFRLPKGNSEKSWALSTEELDFHAMNSPGHKNDTIKFRKEAPGLTFFKGAFWGAYFWRGLYSKGLIYGGKFAFQNRLS